MTARGSFHIFSCFLRCCLDAGIPISKFYGYCTANITHLQAWQCGNGDPRSPDPPASRALVEPPDAVNPSWDARDWAALLSGHKIEEAGVAKSVA